MPINPLTGKPNERLYDVTAAPANDPGDSGSVSTAADYLRFCQMLLNDGELDGKRYLSPTSIRLMTSDQLGSRTTLPLEPGELLMGVQGYTFGLGFMVRRGSGLASVPGTEGEYLWGGAAGTFFWIEPKARLTVVVMAQTPGPIRQYYRRLFKQMVEQAVIADDRSARR
jgi:CubicO group peptidase (beta-lactamase class C family)